MSESTNEFPVLGYSFDTFYLAWMLCSNQFLMYTETYMLQQPLRSVNNLNNIHLAQAFFFAGPPKKAISCHATGQ